MKDNKKLEIFLYYKNISEEEHERIMNFVPKKYREAIEVEWGINHENYLADFEEIAKALEIKSDVNCKGNRVEKAMIVTKNADSYYDFVLKKVYIDKDMDETELTLYKEIIDNYLVKKIKNHKERYIFEIISLIKETLENYPYIHLSLTGNTYRKDEYRDKFIEYMTEIL